MTIWWCIQNWRSFECDGKIKTLHTSHLKNHSCIQRTIHAVFFEASKQKKIWPHRIYIPVGQSKPFKMTSQGKNLKTPRLWGVFVRWVCCFNKKNVSILIIRVSYLLSCFVPVSVDLSHLNGWKEPPGASFLLHTCSVSTHELRMVDCQWRPRLVCVTEICLARSWTLRSVCRWTSETSAWTQWLPAPLLWSCASSSGRSAPGGRWWHRPWGCRACPGIRWRSGSWTPSRSWFGWTSGTDTPHLRQKSITWWANTRFQV